VESNVDSVNTFVDAREAQDDRAAASPPQPTEILEGVVELGPPDELPRPGPDVLDFLRGLDTCDSSAVWLPALRADQEDRWRRGERVPVETYLRGVPALAGDTEAALDLLHHEVLLRQEFGPPPKLDEYRQRFPQYGHQLEGLFALRGALDWGSLLRPAPRRAEPSGPRAPVEAPPTVVHGSGVRPATAPVREEPVLPAVAGYEMLGELGRGGMGVVYRARQLSLNRLVALKMILGGAFADREHLKRFRREAEAVARLQHPNIVQIFDVGVQDSALGRGLSCPYFSLEYVDGGSLAQHLGGNPQPPRQAAAPGRRDDRVPGPGDPLRPPARHRPPRPEAGQRSAHPRRRAQAHRLRPGQADRRRSLRHPGRGQDR
jgi:hypothetical protein